MSHFIDLATAIDMTRQYREQHETILREDYQGRGLLAYSETFDRSAIDALLRQRDCQKLRIYYGMDDKLQVHAILVGVDASDRDILPPSGSARSGDTDKDPDEEGLLVEVGVRCPDQCPPESPLYP